MGSGGIRVRTRLQKAVELTGAFRCETELKAKFSMPYCIAAMLVYGEAGLMQFTEEVRSDPRIHGLKHRIKVEEDISYTEEYPILRIERLSVALKDGQEMGGGSRASRGETAQGIYQGQVPFPGGTDNRQRPRRADHGAGAVLNNGVSHEPAGRRFAR